MSEDDTLRVDVWLWRTRWFKTRAMAAKLVSVKGVRIDRTGMVRKTSKPGSGVLIDDILTFRKDKSIVTVKIVAMPHRRGPASEAQACYELTEANDT